MKMIFHLTATLRHENWVHSNLLKFYSLTDLRTGRAFLYATWLPKAKLWLAVKVTTSNTSIRVFNWFWSGKLSDSNKIHWATYPRLTPHRIGSMLYDRVLWIQSLSSISPSVSSLRPTYWSTHPQGWIIKIGSLRFFNFLAVKMAKPNFLGKTHLVF